MNERDAADAFMGMVNVAAITGLQEAGEVLKKITRERLSQYRPDSKLLLSVDYRTRGPEGSTRSSWARQGSVLGKDTVDIDLPRYQVPKPEKPMSMVFGAGAPYALFVEKGSAPHSGNSNATPEDGTFTEKMLAWGERYGIPLEEVNRIMNNISKFGTKGTPFMPSEQEMEKLVMEIVKSATNRIWGRTKLPDFVIKVE